MEKLRTILKCSETEMNRCNYMLVICYGKVTRFINIFIDVLRMVMAYFLVKGKFHFTLEFETFGQQLVRCTNKQNLGNMGL